MRKRKTVWLYVDGVKLIDVVQAALDNNVMLSDMKKALFEEYSGHDIVFKCE